MILENAMAMVDDTARTERKQLTADQLHDVNGGMRNPPSQAAAIQYWNDYWTAKVFNIFSLW